MPGPITLLTDFGLKDGNVGVMKGVIWSIAPRVQITDLSHQIQPQNLSEAALILLRSAPYFPDGTIHVVVVDPGVGTERRPLAGRVGEQYFVGPDNGVLTMWLEWAEHEGLEIEFVHTNVTRFWRDQISHVFHGRDIFAPVAGHLAAGVKLGDFGPRVDELVRLAIPRPQRTESGWRGEVIHRDHFGSLSTNIRVEDLGFPDQLTIHIGGVEITDLVNTFGERPPGSLVALYGSTGNLIISVVNGSAAERLGVAIGTPVEVLL